MTCIGIDPAYAKPVTLAWRGKDVRGRLLWFCEQADPREHDFFDVLAKILTISRDMGATSVCLEDGFIGRNPQVGMRLAQIRGSIQTVATMAGLECRLVAPSRWQSDCLSSGGVRPHRHAEIAVAAILRANSVTGQDLTEDMAVAVCLAEWGNAHPELWSDEK